MLLYYAARSSDAASAAAEQGLAAAGDDPLVLHSSLDDVPDDGPVLVIDGEALGTGLRRATPTHVEADAVPAAAVRNAAPYRPPRPVTAGGGYVARALGDSNAGEQAPAGSTVALLLIFRRGVWDLPKGTLDPDETVEECALREVREEVGIDRLQVRRALGTTQHGYVDDAAYAVKTTHWYLMQTPERAFTPERREGIRRVAWARWPTARRHIGYDTLRDHMGRVETDVLDSFRDASPTDASPTNASPTNGTRSRP